jgi:RNA polymerase sigma-70 factor (ECF subfamily)
MDQREVVLLVGLEGLSYREVAEALSIPLGTVMSRLSRGRAALRRAMSGQAGDEMHEAEAS